MLPDNLKVGTLDAFFETGTEGIIWAFNNNNNNESGWDALNMLKDGDYLFVEDGNGNIEWEGTISFDYEIRKHARLTGAMQQEDAVTGYTDYRKTLTLRLGVVGSLKAGQQF